MEVLGLCHYCSKPARYSCAMCGRPVCSEHIDKHTHLCQQCSPELRRGRGHDRPMEEDLLR